MINNIQIKSTLKPLNNKNISYKPKKKRTSNYKHNKI